MTRKKLKKKIKRLKKKLRIERSGYSTPVRENY